MITALEVSRYRGFVDYSVDQICPVNLFVGKNNVGKSSLLEAAQLSASSDPFSALVWNTLRRRESSQRWYDASTNPPRWMQLTDLNHVFHGHSIRTGTVTLTAAGAGVTQFSISALSNEQPPLPIASVKVARPESLVFTVSRDRSLLGHYEVTADGYFVDEPRRRNLVHGNDNTLFVTPDSFTYETLYALWGAVIQNAGEESLIRSLRILEPGVNGVFFLPATLGESAPGGILIGRNGTERNPIGTYGDGMRRLLTLAMAFANVSEGMLLVDEVDTGLHYSVMTDLWRLIMESSRSLGTQVFATTHSLDCVRGLHQALIQEPELCSRVAIHKIDSRLDCAVTFTGQKLIEALDADLELR